MIHKRLPTWLSPSSPLSRIIYTKADRVRGYEKPLREAATCTLTNRTTNKFETPHGLIRVVFIASPGLSSPRPVNRFPCPFRLKFKASTPLVLCRVFVPVSCHSLPSCNNPTLCLYYNPITPSTIAFVQPLSLPRSGRNKC